MAFTSTPLSLFSDGPTAEYIEYALPTTDSLPTTTYHHIQHFLPDGTPGASSTHIEYADDPSFSSSRSVSSEATLPSFAPRHSTITTTTPPRREQSTERPSTSPSMSTSTSSSPSRSPSLHVRFAGDLPLPLRPSSSSSSSLPPSSSPSTATSQATDSPSMRTRTSTSPSTSRTRPHLSRNRPSSPYPFVRGEGPPADVLAPEGGRAVGSLRSAREGGEVALSTYARATTFARTAFVDREEVWDESGFLFDEGEE